MKALFLALVLMLPTTEAAEVKGMKLRIGMSAKDVIERWNEPDDVRSFGDKKIWFFEAPGWAHKSLCLPSQPVCQIWFDEKEHVVSQQGVRSDRLHPRDRWK
jgi:hypothetical protein